MDRGNSIWWRLPNCRESAGQHSGWDIRLKIVRAWFAFESGCHVSPSLMISNKDVGPLPSCFPNVELKADTIWSMISQKLRKVRWNLGKLVFCWLLSHSSYILHVRSLNHSRSSLLLNLSTDLLVRITNLAFSTLIFCHWGTKVQLSKLPVFLVNADCESQVINNWSRVEFPSNFG